MRFGRDSTADDVLAWANLGGTVAVVTGATGGIGFETARALASRGAHVVIAGRDVRKRQEAMELLIERVPHASAEAVPLDLTDLDSVRAFASSVVDAHPAITLLVNNAGVMATPFRRTVDGFELQMATNYLGHFLLTGLLAPALRAGAPSRIVNVTSSGPALSALDFEDPNFHNRDYDKFTAYGQSKTANILHVIELDRRLRRFGQRAFAATPGVTSTALGRYMTRDDLKAFISRLPREVKRQSLRQKDPKQGAATIVWAATSPELTEHNGSYIEDCAVIPVPSLVGDATAAQRLWRLSERLVGARFDL